MSDLYHIPNDDGKTYRLKKFVEYQHEVPATHYRFVAKYCLDNKLSKDDIVEASFVTAMTYSEVTTVFILELLSKYNYEQIWQNFGENLNFGSARKHMKLKNRFSVCASDWLYLKGDQPYAFVKSLESTDACKTYKNIQKAIQSIPEIGRFSSDLFLELLVYLKENLSLNIKQPLSIDWHDGSNLTSGIYNIFYEDEKAEEYEKTKAVSHEETLYLTAKLKQIQQAIKSTYPEQDCQITMFLDKVCSFRNLFKNARYGGFHHDRQLAVIKQYQNIFPQYDYLWQYCYEVRKAIYPHKLLGELNGWDGIRKERKKLWTTQGLTGVE